MTNQARSSSRQTLSPFPRSTSETISASSQSGMAAEQQTLNVQSEIAQDMPESPAKSTPSSKAKSTKINPSLLPELNVYSSPCCGLGDVYGIENALRVTDDRLIFAALMKAKDRHLQEYTNKQRESSKASATYSSRFSEPLPQTADEYHRLLEDAYNNADRALRYGHYRMKAGGVGMYIFTMRRCVADDRNGPKRLISFITENKLGTAHAQEFYNPNSGNHVVTVIFSVDKEAWEAKRQEWF